MKLLIMNDTPREKLTELVKPISSRRELSLFLMLFRVNFHLISSLSSPSQFDASFILFYIGLVYIILMV